MAACSPKPGHRQSKLSCRSHPFPRPASLSSSTSSFQEVLAHFSDECEKVLARCTELQLKVQEAPELGVHHVDHVALFDLIDDKSSRAPSPKVTRLLSDDAQSTFGSMYGDDDSNPPKSLRACARISKDAPPVLRRGQTQAETWSEASSKRSSKNRTSFVNVVKKVNDKKEIEAVTFFQSDRFNGLCAMVILANSVFTGIQVDYMLRSELDRLKGHAPGAKRLWIIGEITFCCLFTAELIIRIISLKWGFLMGRERAWNFFDVLIVTSAQLDIFVTVLGSSLSFGAGLVVLRTLRIVRIIRVLRIGQGWAVISTLKTMVFGLASSVHSFGAALILLGGVMYIFALIFMSGALKYFSELDTGDMTDHVSQSVSQLSKYFGSLPSSFWSLGLALSGGEDWNILAETLVSAGLLYKICFMIYIASVLLGLLNILNGIFVNAAMQSSAMDKHMMIERMMKSKEFMVEEMVDLFLQADINHTGSMSWEEFSTFMEDEKVNAYMLAMEIDMSSARKVFRLLDREETGRLTMEDFVNGCIELRGAAKVVDIATFENNTRQMLKDIALGISELLSTLGVEPKLRVEDAGQQCGDTEFQIRMTS